MSEGDRLSTLGLSERGEPGVHGLHHDSPLSDSGGDPFHRARADVTHGEHPGQAGLKGIGPCARIGLASRSCQDETAVIQPYGALDPSGAWNCTDHDENPTHGPFHYLSIAVADLDASQPAVTEDFDDLGMRVDLHVCGATQALDQILRHALRKIAPPVDEAH